MYPTINFSDNILFLGIDYKSSKGGVPEMEKYYSMFFNPYNFLSTTIDGSSIKKLYYGLFALLKFIFILTTNKSIKVVHINGCSGNSFWRKRIFINTSKFFNKKVIYHMHSGGFIEFSSLHPKVVKNTIKKCDQIVALSNSWKSFFKEKFGCTNVTVIPNGIPLPTINSPKEDKNRLVLTFLGKINKNKGIYDILRVLKDVRNDYENKLIFKIGGVGEVETLKKYIDENNLGEFVQYIGWIEGKQKIELLNETDVFILTSYFEGVPVCILEAMSYNIPVIATNVGGIPDIINNGVNGILITPGNTSQIKDALDFLIYNRDKAIKMGKNSQQIIDQYLPNQISTKLSKMYSELLRN